MTIARRVLATSFVGACAGALWWVWYVPQAHSLATFIALHALGALGLDLAAAAARSSWLPFRAVVLAIVFGPIIAPVWLSFLHAAGILRGPSGVVADGIVILALTFWGLALGVSWSRHRRWPLVFSAFLIVAAFVAAPRAGGKTSQPLANATGMESPSRPVVVVGIDGADWRVVQPLMALGELPHLAALIRRGRHGVLRSFEESFSPVVWTSIFSGVTPKHHGLEDHASSDARNRRVPLLWDLFVANGSDALVVNVPGTWPPPDSRDHLRLLSGFPIPTLSSGATGHPDGYVIDTGDGGHFVGTLAPRVENGSFHVEVPIAATMVRPRVPNIDHPLLQAAVRNRILLPRRSKFRLSFHPQGELMEIDGDFTEAPTRVARGSWSPWLSVQADGVRAMFRIHVERTASDELRAYVSPAFQDPQAPRFPFASGVAASALMAPSGPYIVDSLGWRAHRDPRVTRRVPELVLGDEAARAEVTEGLLREHLPHLLVFVYTGTDRMQHAFWGLHDPQAFGVAPSPDRVGLDPVGEAYRDADRTLGRLMAHFPEDTHYWVISDHGVDVDDDATRRSFGESGHRQDGLWVAAGPAVARSDQPLELEILDVLPTLLHCLGAPVAGDLDGRVVEEVCPGAARTRWIASFHGNDESGSGVRPESLDPSRLEQLRSLGYVD